MKTFTVNAETWKSYLAKKAQKNALAKEVKSLEDGFGFPDAKEIAEDIKIEIVNGNNQAVGKMTIYFVDTVEIPAGWRRRIS